MSRRRRISFEDPDQAVNLAPMIDIVFILLIFFVVINSHSRVQYEQLSLPVTSVGEDLTAGQNLNKLLLIFNEEVGQFELNGQPLSEAQLGQRIEQAVRVNPETNVVIRAQGQAPCESVGWRLLEFCSRQGIKAVFIATFLEEERADAG